MNTFDKKMTEIFDVTPTAIQEIQSKEIFYKP